VAAGLAVLEAENKYGSWLASLTMAYSQAWKANKTFTDGVNADIRLADELILQMALIAFPSVAGSFMSAAMKRIVPDAMQKLTSGAVIIDLAKDLTKGAVKGFSGEIISIQKVRFEIPRIPNDPNVWQASVDLRAKAELAGIAGEIKSWITGATDEDPQLVMDFDPLEETNGRLSVSLDNGPSIPLLELTPVDTTKTQVIFQQNWLRGWIDTCMTRIYNETSPFEHISMDKRIVEFGESIGATDIPQRLSAAFRASDWPLRIENGPANRR
jgi:hypothetical protein